MLDLIRIKEKIEKSKLRITGESKNTFLAVPHTQQVKRYHTFTRLSTNFSIFFTFFLKKIKKYKKYMLFRKNNIRIGDPKKNCLKTRKNLTVTSNSFTIVPMSNTENQRAFKERLYAAGYKQKIIWVARDPEKGEHLTRSAFLRKFDRLIAGWSSSSLSELFNTILNMIETRKGVRKKG
jgi:hypothetical protein